MAKGTSFCFVFLSLLSISCSGTLVGFSYRERLETATSTTAGTLSFLTQNKISPSQIRIFVTDHRNLSTLTNSEVSVDLYLNKSLVENFINSKPSAISWLQAHLLDFLPQVSIKSIIASCGGECIGQKERLSVLSALKSIHSVLSKLHKGREVKISVAFPLSLLEKLKISHEYGLHRILLFMKKANSFVMIEDSIDGELSMGDQFVQSIIKKANLAASILPCKDVPIVLTIKSPAIPSSMEVAQFSERVSKYLESSAQITGRIMALYAEVHTTETFEQEELKREEEEMFPLSRREILSNFHIRRTLDHTENPSTTVFTINPTSATPGTTPPDTPTIITVPSTNPVTVFPTPTNPAATPVTVPSSTPVPLSPTNLPNSSVPVTNPATTPISFPGAQPATNPLTYYSPPPTSGSVPVVKPQPPPSNTNAPAITYPPPPPSGSVPVVNPQPPPANTNAPAITYPPPPPSGSVPVVNPQPPPANTNAPAITYPPPPPSGSVPVVNPQPPPANTNAPTNSGQRWCVAKTGAPITALQSALDYACGSGRADCSQIQQGGSCFNPNTVQNHASYAFNSYYQKNPAPTSCDFGGTATLVNANPTSGSCIYPSSSSSSSSTTTTPPSSPASSTPTPTPPTSSSSGTGATGTPPSVLNSSNPTSVTTPDLGFDSPPVVNTTSSHSASLRPFLGCMVLVTSLVTSKLSLRP